MIRKHGHSSLDDAQEQAERRAGRCFGCWSETPKHEAPTGHFDTPHGFRSEGEEHRAAILVVDDDVDVRDALAAALESEGYSVLSTASGAEALEVLRSRAIARVILLDLMMPLMDGYEFRAQQQEDPTIAEIPVIVITAGASVATAELDGLTVVHKPLDLSSLLSTIRQHCR